MRKPLYAVVALVATFACGVAALLAVGAHSRSDMAQTLGVAPAGPVATLKRGQQVCQTPVSLADRFRRVRFYPTTTTRPTPPIAVTIRDVDSHALLGRGRLAGGYPRVQPQVVGVGDVPAAHRVSLCFRNLGAPQVSILGDSLGGRFCTPTGATVSPYPIGCAPGWARPTLSTSQATMGRTVLDGDLAAEFLREPPRSLLTRFPLMIRRASLFKPAFAGRGLWWAFIAGWLLLAPLGLAYALRRTLREDAT